MFSGGYRMKQVTWNGSTTQNPWVNPRKVPQKLQSFQAESIKILTSSALKKRKQFNTIVVKICFTLSWQRFRSYHIETSRMGEWGSRGHLINRSFTVRSSCPKVFRGKGVLKNFANFTGKHMRWSLFSKKLPASWP